MTGWARSWVTAAEQLIEDGDDHLGRDRLTEACQSYLRAAEWYRLALRGSGIGPADRRRWSDAQVSAFRAALPLLPHPATAFRFDAPGGIVVGYLFRPDDVGPECPAVIIPADDTAVETLYPTLVGVLDAGIVVATFAVAAPDGRPVVATPATVVEVEQWLRRQPGVIADRVASPFSAGPFDGEADRSPRGDPSQ